MKCIYSVQNKTVDKLNEILSEFTNKKILVFTGKVTLELFEDYIKNDIRFDCDICNDFDVNPKQEQVYKAIKNYSITDYSAIIAFGGGSVIDFAKLYKFYAKAKIPLIAIPTTAGTGSESTQFAVVYIEKKKHSIDNQDILPNFVILDGQFLLNSPKYVKACSSIDAYCQAIESYWAITSTPESKEYARQAIKLIKNNIVDFVLEDEIDKCNIMIEAANLAGKAINITRTTAAHALSYEITTKHNIAHGHAVALSMSDLFEANSNIEEASIQDPKGVKYVKTTILELLSLIGTDNFRFYWQDLLDTIGLEFRFNKLKISNKKELIDAVDKQRLKNNPKDISKDLAYFWK